MSILKSHCSRSSETTHKDVANSDFGILTPFQPAVRMGRCTSSHTSLRFFLGTDLSAQLRMASKMIFDHFPAEGFLFNLSKKRSKVEGALHFLPRKHLDHNSDKNSSGVKKPTLLQNFLCQHLNFLVLQLQLVVLQLQLRCQEFLEDSDARVVILNGFDHFEPGCVVFNNPSFNTTLLVLQRVF